MTMHHDALIHIGLLGLGFITGAYGTLIGAGGGFVLMPALLLLYPAAGQETLTAISLAVVFFNALSGTEAYAVMKRIDYRSGLMYAAASIPGAALGALHTSFISRGMFDTIFGTMLLLLSAVLFTRPHLAGAAGVASSGPPGRFTVARKLIDAGGNSYDYSYNPFTGIGLSLVVGYVSSFLGIGGGIIHVPALAYLLHFPIHVATATSHFILVFMSLTGTVVHIFTGSLAHGAHKTLFLAGGVIVGAQLGALLSNRIHGRWIIRSLAIALGLLGLRLLLSVSSR